MLCLSQPTLSAPLLKVMTKMILVMKYIQVKFVNPGSWQTGIWVSATVSTLKLNDTKIRITISPSQNKTNDKLLRFDWINRNYNC